MRPLFTEVKMASQVVSNAWLKQKNSVKGFLLDIYGVLYDVGSSGPEPIKGSVEAIQRLNSLGIPYRLCSNTSTHTKEDICTTLTSMGFDVKVNQIFPPAPAAFQMLKKQALRPYLLVSKDVLGEFDGLDQSNPNCVVLGDATSDFTYDNLNRAFRVLIDAPAATLITLGAGKYYKENDQLQLDVGPYAKALEYASGVKAVTVGKPDAAFFQAAVDDMQLTNNQVVMIGDDIVSDVGGAQACGICGVQVRTGKYRPQDEPHPEVTPDGYVDNLLDAVTQFSHN